MPPAYLLGPAVPRIKYWGCTGKASYVDRENAMREAARAAGKLGIKHMPVYECHYCKLWHATSKKMTADQRIMSKLARKMVNR